MDDSIKAKGRFAIAILIIFVLPITMLYVTYKGGHQVHKTEPSAKIIEEPKLVEGSFSFRSHQTDTITSEILADKVLVVSFFNLPARQATEATQRAHYKLAEIQKSANKYKHLRLISVSDDLFKNRELGLETLLPDAVRDSLQMAAAQNDADTLTEFEQVTFFARKFSSNANWHFLHGADGEAERYYKALRFEENGGPAFGSSGEYPLVAIVDKEGAIRGYYNPRVDEELEQLMQDVLYLLFVADGKMRAY